MGNVRVRFRGRRKPYTEIGIARLKCRCGRKAWAQWQVCANGNRYAAVCRECDYKLNEAAMLTAFGDSRWTRRKLREYAKRIGV